MVSGLRGGELRLEKGVALVEVVTTDDEVVWQNVRASRFFSAPEVYAPVGPFRFTRAQYEESLRRPRHAAAPIYRPRE